MLKIISANHNLYHLFVKKSYLQESCSVDSQTEPDLVVMGGIRIIRSLNHELWFMCRVILLQKQNTIEQLFVYFLYIFLVEWPITSKSNSHLWLYHYISFSIRARSNAMLLPFQTSDFKDAFYRFFSHVQISLYLYY